MHRLFTSETLAVGATVSFSREQSHYIQNVLRLKHKTEVHLFNGDGCDYCATIELSERKNWTGRIYKRLENATAQPRIGLIQGLAKQSKMDFIIQKATELGVAAIQPIHTEHSAVKLDAQRSNRRHTHWQKIIYSACEQSGRALIPLLQPVSSLPNITTLLGNTHALHPNSPLIWENPIYSEHKDAPIQWVAIGPEGGFSNHEIDYMVQHGARVMRWGTAILRCETCAIASLSQALYRF